VGKRPTKKNRGGREGGKGKGRMGVHYYPMNGTGNAKVIQRGVGKVRNKAPCKSFESGEEPRPGLKKCRQRREPFPRAVDVGGKVADVLSQSGSKKE